jgi:hypothetical protein
MYKGEWLIVCGGEKSHNPLRICKRELPGSGAEGIFLGKKRGFFRILQIMTSNS